VPNQGGERAPVGRVPDAVPVVLSGTLRWVEPDGGHAALLVERGTGVARRLAGETLTLDLATTAVRTADRDGDGRRSATDLLPGDVVTIKARLPRGLPCPPAMIAPRRLILRSP
jgi:hypothetical protein